MAAEPLLEVAIWPSPSRRRRDSCRLWTASRSTSPPGEVLAVVGESGCGKSVTAMTLLGLTRSPNARFEGTANYKGTELIGASDEELQRIRGAEIAMIFQDPMTSLNPVMRIGDQIIEQIQAHEQSDRRAGPRAHDRAARARRASRARASAWTPTRTSSRAECASG